MKIEYGLGAIEPEFAISIGSLRLAIGIFMEQRTYGKGCDSIIFAKYCQDEKLFGPFPDFVEFSKGKRQIFCSLNYDFKSALACKRKIDFVNYTINLHLSRCEDFYDLDVIDFEIDLFIKDLELFFEKYASEYDGKEELINYSDGWD